MPEVVPRTDADECEPRTPHRQTGLGQSVRRTVVRHLEHVDDSTAGSGERTLRIPLGVPRQHRVERSALQQQDDAGVVRLRAGKAGGGPQDGDTGSAHSPSHARDEGFRTSSLSREPSHYVRVAGSLRGAAHADDTDLHRPRQPRESTRVVIVRVRQYDAVESAYAESAESGAKIPGARPGIDEHRRAPVAVQDGVTLTDVENRERRPRGRGRAGGQERERQEAGNQHASCPPRPGRSGPAQPQPREAGGAEQ